MTKATKRFSDEQETGTVVRILGEYGFISCKEVPGQLYFKTSWFRGQPPLREGDKVSFVVKQFGRNFQAHFIARLSGGNAQPELESMKPRPAQQSADAIDFDTWIASAFSQTLAPVNAERTFIARRLDSTDYVLVQYTGQNPKMEWSVLVWFREPRVLDEVRIVREINRRFSQSLRLPAKEPFRSTDIPYYMGRLTDHGWHVHERQNVRERAILSALFEHGQQTISQTLCHLQRTRWAQHPPYSDNIEQDLVFARTNGVFGADLRRKYDIPTHCTGVISVHLLKSR